MAVKVFKKRVREWPHVGSASDFTPAGGAGWYLFQDIELAAHAHPVVRVPAVLLWRGLDRWTEDHEHHAHPPAVARPDLDELREVGALRRRARRVHARSACPNGDHRPAPPDL